jgi:hypothetical protein
MNEKKALRQKRLKQNLLTNYTLHTMFRWEGRRKSSRRIRKEENGGGKR